MRLDPIVAYKSYSAARSERDDAVARMTLLGSSVGAGRRVHR